MRDPLPNLSVVDPQQMVLRGGQPTEEGWRRLHEMGITNVVKLNEDDRMDGGPDDGAAEYGMGVTHIPIDSFEQVFDVRKSKVETAVDAIRPYTYVHCKHGEDRTGVCCYFYRRRQGWSKDEAESEMLRHGFHKSLHGLWELVEDDSP